MGCFCGAMVFIVLEGDYCAPVITDCTREEMNVL